MADAPILTNYFPQAKKDSPVPKFVLFSGHAENVTPLLDVFKWHVLENPPPASSIFVDYLECEKCKGAEQW